MLILSTNTPADWPAIVQAFGSIIAILVTTALFLADKWHDRLVDGQRAAAAAKNLCTVLIVELDDSMANVRTMITLIDTNGGQHMHLPMYAGAVKLIGKTLDARQADFPLMPPDIAVKLYSLLGLCAVYNSCVMRAHNAFGGNTSLAPARLKDVSISGEDFCKVAKEAIEMLKASGNR